MQRGQINFPVALERRDIYRWVTLLCTICIPLFNGQERCVFYRFQSKNGHNNDTAQKEGKTCQKKLQQRLHSVQIHLRHHSDGVMDATPQAFMRLIKLLVDVWFYHQVFGSTFPKWLLLSCSHTFFPGVSPSHRQMQISQHVKGRKISLAGIFFGVCVHHGFFCLPPDSAVSLLSVHR